MKEYTANGILYEWELAGPQGASFLLFPGSEHTPEDIKKAKQWLRNNKDVVWLRVANEDDRDQQYRGEIFSHPGTKHLKWYQMNVDNPKLIREQRLAGTSIDDYVKKFVLPFVEQSEKEHLAQHGDKMYNF